MGYLDTTSKFREFNPLKKPQIQKSDCILHYCVFLQKGGGIGNRKPLSLDFNIIKKNINRLTTCITSNKVGFRLDLIISINGHIEDPEHIAYFKSINGLSYSNGVHITVFQRQNGGFQWGGFHDVWMRYKDIECNWYATMESDVFFINDNWYDIVVGVMNGCDGTYGFAGQLQREKPFDSINDTDKRVWRNGSDNIIDDINPAITIHSCGGFYFCRKEFLNKMDNVYGCFTHSMGCNHWFDGIVLGEVCFSQKTTSMGYKWASKKIPHFIVSWEQNQSGKWLDI